MAHKRTKPPILFRARVRAGWANDVLNRGRRRYALMVYRALKRCRKDSTREALLWRCGNRAVRRGLWKYPESKKGCPRFACYALLALMVREDAKTDANYRGPSGKWRWLSDNGWTPCGEQSRLYENKKAEAG